MSRNTFYNPANGASYAWQVNHDPEGEEEAGRERQIERTANTGLVGSVDQQGDDGPYILSLSGKILHRAQFVAFWNWYELCRTQSIWFYDFDGQGYEVQIIAFKPKRRGAVNMRTSDPKTHFWTYSIQMRVYRFLQGDMVTAGVTP